MTTTATVFVDYEDFPSEIQNYFDECVDVVTDNHNDSFINFPLDWNSDDFALDEDDEPYPQPAYVDAYFEVVRYLKANMVAGTELAIVC